MLPVCLYNIQEPQELELLSHLEACASDQGLSYTLRDARGDAAASAVLAAEAAEAVLFLIGIDRLRPKGDLTALKLCRRVIRTNRNHYVVPVLQNAADLQDVLSVCAYLAGVLCIPLSDRRVLNVFRTVVRDFVGSHQKKDKANEGRFILLQVDNTSYRVPVDQILFAQAIDKKIEIVLKSQTLQLYANMEEILDRLGEGFLRCHRSYIINKAQVLQIDWTNMLFTLKGDITIPFSRTYRAALKEVFS